MTAQGYLTFVQEQVTTRYIPSEAMTSVQEQVTTRYIPSEAMTFVQEQVTTRYIPSEAMTFVQEQVMTRYLQYDKQNRAVQMAALFIYFDLFLISLSYLFCARTIPLSPVMSVAA